MLGATKLVDQLDSAAPPCFVARKAQSLEDESVDLIPYEQLGEHELRSGRQRPDGVVADSEKNPAGYRFLVVLDFLLDEQLVLVLE
jgi:hypothetical protein